MATTWLSSDTHFGHAFMAKWRGFASADETDPEVIAEAIRRHDERILANIFKRVRRGDELFLLGDLMLGKKADGLAHLGRITEAGITVHVILGNHDRAHPMNGNSHAHLRPLLEVVESVQVAGMLRHEGRKIHLSHFPYDGEGELRLEADERAGQWRLRDEGKMLFHGHVHDELRARRSANGTPMVHVGLDSWGLFPVSLHDALSAGLAL